MMMEQELPLLVVATRNAHKTGEIRAMLAGEWEVKDLADYPQAPPVDETGVTFTENATLKALSCLQVHSRVRWRMIPGWRWMCWAAVPAFGPPPSAGRKGTTRGTTSA